MTTITGFKSTTPEGAPVLADAHGNNVALKCLTCGGPVLAVLLQHQRGSSETKPTRCQTCNASYWLEVVPAESRLIVHRLTHKHSGRYCLGRAPDLTADQNLTSWKVVSAMLEAYGGAEYEEFAAAVRQHDHPTGGHAFVDYCIRNGWLRQA